MDPEMMQAEEQIDPTADMSDDDIAASLGYITTLSEQMAPPMDPMEELAGEGESDDLQEGDDSGEESAEEPEDKDSEQDDEIAKIRAELEALKREDDKATEDTEPSE